MTEDSSETHVNIVVNWVLLTLMCFQTHMSVADCLMCSSEYTKNKQTDTIELQKWQNMHRKRDPFDLYTIIDRGLFLLFF